MNKPDLNDPAETEPCFHCKKEINVDAPHWRLHITTDLRTVAADYAGTDSQGTFALGGECRRRYPDAFKSQALTPEPETSKPDLNDPEVFQRSCLQMIEAEPSRKGFWSILLADSLRGEATALDREMMGEALRTRFSGGCAEQECPGLNFVNGADGQNVHIAFGYFRGEPTAAVFRGSDEAPIMIPREVLQIALDQGWGER